MVARPGRKLAIAHGTELPAQGLLGDGDAEFLKNPLAQINEPPAHNAMHRGDRPALDNGHQCLALGIVQLRWLTRGLAIDKTIRTLRIEP